MKWDDVTVQELEDFWREGLSAGKIAKIFAKRKILGPCTRNAVIGKIHRLGLPGRATPHKPVKRTRAAPRHPSAPRTLGASTPRPKQDTRRQGDAKPVPATIGEEYGNTSSLGAYAMYASKAMEAGLRNLGYPHSARFADTVAALKNAEFVELTMPAALEVLGVDNHTGEPKRIGWDNIQIFADAPGGTLITVMQTTAYGGFDAKVRYEAQVANKPQFAADDEGEDSGICINNLVYRSKELKKPDGTIVYLVTAEYSDDASTRNFTTDINVFKETVVKFGGDILESAAAARPKGVTAGGASYQPIDFSAALNIDVIPVMLIKAPKNDTEDDTAHPTSGPAICDAVLASLTRTTRPLPPAAANYLAGRSGPRRERLMVDRQDRQSATLEDELVF